MLKKFLDLVIAFVFLLSALPLTIYADESTEYALVITAFGNNGSSEFVELYNTSDEVQSIDGWRVVYTNGSGDNMQDIAVLSGSIPAESYLLFVSETYETILDPDIPSNTFLYNRGMADSGGYIWLYKNMSDAGEDLLIDRLAWGSANLDSEPVASKPGTGESLKRCVDAQSNYVNRNDNELDFMSVGIPHFQIGPYCAGMEPVEDEEEPNDTLPIDELTCEGIIISELMPNPDRADGGYEFIELYNPTTAIINLDGCGLQLNDDPIRGFGDINLQPQQYMAFYDSDTGIVLPNAAGGTVYLIDNNNELYSVVYPGGLDDDVAWAWFADGDWQQTYSPTPGAANIKQPTEPCSAGQERNEETGRCSSLAIGGGSDLKPCRSDQFRNPLTNRCKLKDSDPGLKPCRSDQFRNPETSRCKLIEAAGSSLKPCNADQFRNPATNRCKKIGSGSTLKPCKPNQERNPETNRCRKVRGTSTADLAKIKDVEAPIVSGNYSWILAGVAGGGVLAYAVWEWRREILGFLTKLKP